MFRQFSTKSSNTINNQIRTKLTQGGNQNSTKSFFSKFSKKNFCQNGQNPLMTLLPFTRALVIGNCVMYGLSFAFSKEDFSKYFLYNTRSLEQGRILAPITSHFAKNDTVSFAIDTLITGMIGNTIESQVGMQLMQKMVLMSGLGALAITHLTCGQSDYICPETMVRFVIYFMTIQNPHMALNLMPLPFQVKIMYVAGVIGLFDIISNKMYNFAPLMACMMMRQKGGF
jgi:hypothetical protein